MDQRLNERYHNCSSPGLDQKLTLMKKKGQLAMSYPPGRMENPDDLKLLYHNFPKNQKNGEFDSAGYCYPKGANEATKKDPKE